MWGQLYELEAERIRREEETVFRVFSDERSAWERREEIAAACREADRLVDLDLDDGDGIGFFRALALAILVSIPIWTFLIAATVRFLRMVLQ